MDGRTEGAKRRPWTKISQEASMGDKVTGKRILVVDDNEGNAALLATYLRKAGHDVFLAYDGSTALDTLREVSLDLMILDACMPGMSGYDVLEAISSEPTISTRPVLMLTALNQPHNRQRAVDLGVDDFLSKPVSKLDFIHRVEALLEVAELPSGLQRTLAYCEALDRRRA
jgi:DNA-binding response OmpR family regulator